MAENKRKIKKYSKHVKIMAATAVFLFPLTFLRCRKDYRYFYIIDV